MDRVQYESLVVQDLVNLHKSQELNLSPWYQRRSVWSKPQKSYLINTLHEQKPIPAVYIRHSIDLNLGKSIREIVDGQQRCRSILEYVKGEFTAWHTRYPQKVHYADLNNADRQKFLLTAVPVGYLLGATDADVIDIFGRINSVSKSLNAQEKRNANYSGEFKQFCLAQASSRLEFWRSFNIFTANAIARMDEVQFISDIVLNMINGLSDYSAQKLNVIYKEFDEEFQHREEIESRLDRVFDFLVSLNPDSIKETIFKRVPIFFSLFLILDQLEELNRRHIEDHLFEIDERFNSDQNQTEADQKFVTASTSTTQRLRQRTIRAEYLNEMLAN